MSRQYQIFACHFVYIEVFHHKEKILKASKLPEPELLELMLGLLNRIDFLSEIHIATDIWQKAEHLCMDIDPNDTPHIALSLHLNLPFETGDEKLKTHLRNHGFDLLFDVES